MHRMFISNDHSAVLWQACGVTAVLPQAPSKPGSLLCARAHTHRYIRKCTCILVVTCLYLCPCTRNFLLTLVFKPLCVCSPVHLQVIWLDASK